MQNSTLYLQRLRQLLQMEYDSEKEEFRVQSEKMGIKRKIHRGICWYPIEAGRSYYNSLNQLVVEVIKKDHDEADEDIEHLFEYGKPVQFFSFNAQYLNDDIIVGILSINHIKILLKHLIEINLMKKTIITVKIYLLFNFI